MIKSKMGIKGRVIARVMTLDEVGTRKLEELRNRIPDRKDIEYKTERARIYAEHAHMKRRVSWRPTTLFKILKGVRTFKEFFDCLRYEMAINHNIVTDEGDAMVADLMAQTPARTKVDNTNGYIEVGTGFVSEIKTRTSCTTPTGSPEVMDATYPKLKGAWGAANDNVTQYRATFEAGDLDATGIDEAALLNNAIAASGDCLAYAEISPSVNMTTADTLQVDWELTFTGS